MVAGYLVVGQGKRWYGPDEAFVRVLAKEEGQQRALRQKAVDFVFVGTRIQAFRITRQLLNACSYVY